MRKILPLGLMALLLATLITGAPATTAQATMAIAGEKTAMITYTRGTQPDAVGVNFIADQKYPVGVTYTFQIAISGQSPKTVRSQSASIIIDKIPPGTKIQVTVAVSGVAKIYRGEAYMQPQPLLHAVTQLRVKRDGSDLRIAWLAAVADANKNFVYLTRVVDGERVFSQTLTKKFTMADFRDLPAGHYQAEITETLLDQDYSGATVKSAVIQISPPPVPTLPASPTVGPTPTTSPTSGVLPSSRPTTHPASPPTAVNPMMAYLTPGNLIGVLLVTLLTFFSLLALFLKRKRPKSH